MKRESFAGKRVLVMGLGRFGGGVDAAQFAHRAGAKVIITDLASAEHLADSISRLAGLEGIEFHLGSHDPADFEQADVVVANPAVPPDNEFLQIARRAGKRVTAQISIFFELCPAQIIGVTGANGKSTTTALTAHLLEKARCDLPHTKYQNVWLSGNIGNQPLLTVLDQIEADDLVVLELSSFQLEQLVQIQKAPDVALLTNLTPNHLDRYETFANYCAAKENIFKFQKLDQNRPAVSIFNAEDKVAAGWLAKYNEEAGRICIRFSSDDVSPEIHGVFRLPGRANLSNLAAAMAIAKHFGVGDERIIRCLPEFKALPHRLELIAEISGVGWYNDSKATTPQSAITALEAFEQPIIFIAGGYDKHLPFDELGRKIAEKAKTAILIGQTAHKIAQAIKTANMSLQGAKRRSRRDGLRHNLKRRETKVKTVNSLADAVQLANRLSQPGDVVLLSPACASYDMFENYEQRGREFTRLVQSLDAQRIPSL